MKATFLPALLLTACAVACARSEPPVHAPIVHAQPHGSAAPAGEPAAPNAPLDPAAEKQALGTEWTKWFPSGSTLRPVTDAAFPLFAVCSLAGQTNGWVFRTDRVPPAVRGMHGEIGVLVGVGRDALVKGVHVLETHENPPWFNRLAKAGFYDRFLRQRADGVDAKADTVTGATVSSTAVRKDVFQSSQTVLAVPAVKALLTPPPAAAP